MSLQIEGEGEVEHQSKRENLKRENKIKKRK